MFAVFLKGTQPERPQAARQAAVDQIALAVRERDAGMLVGELRQRRKSASENSNSRRCR